MSNAFVNTGKLEGCDQETLVKLCLHHIEIIERLITWNQHLDEFLHKQAGAFNAAGNMHSEKMRMILDNIAAVGPGILNSKPPTKQ